MKQTSNVWEWTKEKVGNAAESAMDIAASVKSKLEENATSAVETVRIRLLFDGIHVCLWVIIYVDLCRSRRQ